MHHLRTLAILVSISLPFSLSAGCASDNLSSKGQMIECTVTPGALASCHPVTSDDGAPGTCIDRDEDGDGDAHDSEAEDDEGSGSGSGASSTDDDGDGTADADDADDDNDGVGDDRDCDEQPGQDDDDSHDA